MPIYENGDVEKEANKLIHLTKLQRVILLSSLKSYKYLFAGNVDEWTGPPVETPIKDKVQPYHVRDFPILVIHIET